MREVRVEGIPEISLPGALRSPSQVPLAGHRRDEAFVSESSVAYGPVGPVASSQAFAQALRKALSASRYDDPVLLLGETGTSKTMIARRIHGESSRKVGPIVEVNCSAIAESLAESELFGNVRGAFTGAEKPRSGKFRAAQGGTLFLDEVGDLSLEIQAKLLKALEDKTVTPVGSDEPASADARLIAATNRDLPGMIREGKFRRDLYERLKVVVISLPPLRERREDIRDLASLFLSNWNQQYRGAALPDRGRLRPP